MNSDGTNTQSQHSCVHKEALLKFCTSIFNENTLTNVRFAHQKHFKDHAILMCAHSWQKQRIANPQGNKATNLQQNRNMQNIECFTKGVLSQVWESQLWTHVDNA